MFEAGRSNRFGSEPWGLEVVLEEVRERYSRRWALDGVSLRVAPGEVVALAGPPANGACALLRMIAAGRAPQSGAVRLIGQPALQAIDWELFRARSIAHLCAPDSLLAGLSVQANLEGPLMDAHRDWRERRERVMAALESFGLESLARSLVGRLEPWMQARVRLAMALITRPRLLLVDQSATSAAVTEILDALALYAGLRESDGDPTVIIADASSGGRTGARRTVEIPYRAVARTPRATRRALRRAARQRAAHLTPS